MQSGNFLRYYNIISPIHFLNSLCKIIGFLVFIFMSIICSSFSVLCSLFIILLYLIVISNISFKKYLDVLFRLKFLYLFILIFNLFFFNFYDSIIIVSRVCLISLYLFVLLYTTTTNELIYGFSMFFRLFSYMGFPVIKFSIKISLFFNFIPYYFLEYDKIFNLKKSMGLKYLSVREKFRVFVLVYKRLKSHYDAINIGNYNCATLSFYDSKFHVSDVYLICCHIVILMFVLIKEVVL